MGDVYWMESQRDMWIYFTVYHFSEQEGSLKCLKSKVSSYLSRLTIIVFIIG